LVLPPPIIIVPATNDLQILGFTSSIKKNGVVTTQSPLGYFSASDNKKTPLFQNDITKLKQL